MQSFAENRTPPRGLLRGRSGKTPGALSRGVWTVAGEDREPLQVSNQGGAEEKETASLHCPPLPQSPLGIWAKDRSLPFTQVMCLSVFVFVFLIGASHGVEVLRDGREGVSSGSFPLLGGIS